MPTTTRTQSPAQLTTRSVLRYPGGKTRAIGALDPLLPQGDSPRTVLSPFIGGGSYELHLIELGASVTGYDAYEPLVNFWTHLLSNPRRLATTANKLRPLDAEKFRALQERAATRHANIADAAAYLAVNRSSFSGSTLSGGFSKSASKDRFNDALIERVRNFSNSRLTVAHGSFEDTIRGGFDLIFADPPYWLPGTGNKLYGDRGNMHDGFDHHLFREVMGAVEDPWLITYNDTPELRRLWRGYTLKSVCWSYGMNKSKQSSELVITNYDLAGS